jgi:DNA processing protein
MKTHHLPFWLAALYLPEIGPRKFVRWLAKFSDIKALFTASTEELRAAGLTEAHILSLQSPDWKAVERDLAWSEISGNHLISCADAVYPDLLKDISDPPLLLYVKGNVQALQRIQIAMVGARNATSAGLKNAELFAATLASAGYGITSGLALGIDGASHRGTIKARGVTIAVCGTGLNHIYPRSHVTLVNDIIEHQGAVISEFPLPVPPLAANFPRRNRIIGGLSVGVLVVEAALKSGSLITARHALDNGREVFAIPGSIHNPLTRGCHHLIRQGAKLVETAADIIEELGSFGVPAPCPRAATVGPQIKEMTTLSPFHRQVLEQITYEITSMDVIVLRSGLTIGELSSILLILELNGYIQSVPGGFVREMYHQ